MEWKYQQEPEIDIYKHYMFYSGMISPLYKASTASVHPNKSCNTCYYSRSPNALEAQRVPTEQVEAIQQRDPIRISLSMVVPRDK